MANPAEAKVCFHHGIESLVQNDLKMAIRHFDQAIQSDNRLYVVENGVKRSN